MSKLKEIETIEGNDAHHDFGGPHGNKGNAFAHYWLITSLFQREKAGVADYMFVCEYVQDIAEFDSSSAPLKVVLYQLKKMEGGYWTASDLTGQVKNSKTKDIKEGKPIVKLFKSINAFKNLQVQGAFVTNTKFDVRLSREESSTNRLSISLNELHEDYRTALVQGLAELCALKKDDINLAQIELQSVALEVNDLEQHTTGIAFKFLEQVASNHSAQASSLVDALYVKISAASRPTNKCATWTELVERRGFGKKAFKQAIESLKTIPNREGEMSRLLDRLSINWSSSEHIKVKAKLLQIAREKLIVGTGNRWQIDVQPVRQICSAAEKRGQPDDECFEMICAQLVDQLPEINVFERKALAIHEMIESWTQNQTHA